MAGFYPIPPVIEAQLLVQFSDAHKAKGIESEWRGGSGAVPDVFLEGITSTPNGMLYVVDIPFGRILKVDPETKEIKECVQWAEGEPNGLAVRDDGKMLVADYRRGLLLFDPKENTIKPFLPRRNLESWKGLNDLVINSKGDVYFTDQGQTGLQDPTGGVWCYTAQGKLHQLINNGASPNGIVLSPDEKFLYVAMTRSNEVWRMPVLEDGSTVKVNKFFVGFGNSGPDGLTIDEEGSLFIAHPSLACVFVVDKHGIPKARIQSGGTRPLVTNCIFGSGPNDKKRLYITNSLDGKIEYVDWHCGGGTPIRAV
ncbi:hypothetical protein JCM8547_006724 [Rhodosporidiobolus lusitaniae]